MCRRLFTLAAAGSAILWAATCVLWVRSYRHAPGAEGGVGAYVAACRARYTLRSEPGRVTLFVPPDAPAPDRRGDGAGRETADALAARLSNLEIEWIVNPHRGESEWPLTEAIDRLYGPEYGSPHFRPGSPAARLLAGRGIFDGGRPLFSDDELTAPLLRALEHPDQFAVAHLMMSRMLGPADEVWEEGPGGTKVQVVDGLRAELHPDPGRAGVPKYRTLTGEDQPITPPYAGTVDPGQLAAVRDAWHRRLDVPAGSVPYWAVVTATACLPALAAAARLRRSRRRRRGLCPACGYDLRATPARCPECGAVPTTRA